VDLRDGAVDAPHGAHFAPVEDELALNVGEFHGVEFRIYEISVNREIEKLATTVNRWNTV
jgi:hypothetical protein